MIIGYILIPALILIPIFKFLQCQCDDGMPVMTNDEWDEYHRNIMMCTSPAEAKAYEREYKMMLLEKRKRERKYE